MKQFKFSRDFVNVMKFTTNFITQTRLWLLLHSYLTSISGLSIFFVISICLLYMYIVMNDIMLSVIGFCLIKQST